MYRIEIAFILAAILVLQGCSVIPDLPGPIGIPGF